MFPIESFIKLTFLSIHVFFEIYTGLHKAVDSDRLVFENENAHHVCMISGFIIASLIEILIYYGMPLPSKADYMFNLLAFLIQAILMGQHLTGDAGLEYEVHKLWTIIIILSFISACIEAYKPNSFWPVYLRVFFFLSQGTWLMQVAFVVWPQTSNPFWHWKMDHTSHTWLSISLMYHFIGCAILLMGQYVFVYFTIGLFDKYYKIYEDDLQKSSRFKLKNFKDNDGSDSKEYSFLINEDEDS